MSLAPSNLTLLPSKYPHQRTRELSQEASTSDGNSSGTETDRTPRAISTSRFPSASPSSDHSNSSPASFSSSGTITGRTPRIRVSIAHRRGQSDATAPSNLQPLIITSALETSRPTSEIYGSFNSSTTNRRRSHGRTPSTIATPPSAVVPTRKNRASTISSGDAPLRSTGLHYKKPSLSTICNLPSMDENSASSARADSQKIITPLCAKRRSKALSDALSSRRRSSTISGGPPPSFDGTAGQQKTIREDITKSHRRSRTRGGSVSAVRSLVEVDTDLQLQRSRPSSSVLGLAQDVIDMERQTPMINASAAFSTNTSSIKVPQMYRSSSSPAGPTSSPPVDSLDWSTYIDEGYNLSPTSSTFSDSRSTYPSMSRTSSQATTISIGEPMRRTHSEKSSDTAFEYSSSESSDACFSRPHSRSSYEPTGVDWLDEELACASSDEEDLRLDSVSFPRPRARIEPKRNETGLSPAKSSKRLPPSMPLPVPVFDKQAINPDSSPHLSFMTPPSSPNPDDSPHSAQPPDKRASLPQVVTQIVTSVEAERVLSETPSPSPHHSASTRLFRQVPEDAIQRLASQSACQAVPGEAHHRGSLVSRRSKRTIAPLSAPQNPLPATPDVVSPTSTSIPALQIDFASAQPPSSEAAQIVHEEDSVVRPRRRGSSFFRPDTADSSGSEALSISSSNSNQKSGRGSFSTDASSLLGSPCSPSSILPAPGGEAMVKSASADVGQSFTPMRPPRSPRRGSVDALSQATSTSIPTSKPPKPLPYPSLLASEFESAPSLPPLRPSSTFSPDIKLPSSPKRSKKKLPLTPIRMTSLENAVAVAPSSRHSQETSGGLLGGWLSQDHVPLGGRVSPCTGHILESFELDSDSESGEESWWSGEEDEGAQRGRKSLETFLGGDDEKMVNQQCIRGETNSLIDPDQSASPDSGWARAASSPASSSKAPKLSAAAAKRLGLSMDGTVPSTIAGRREQSRERKEEIIKSSIPSYPASPLSSILSRVSPAFPPFPGTDSTFSDKHFLTSRAPSPATKALQRTPKTKMFKTRTNGEDPFSYSIERPISSMSFRDRFDSNATRSSKFYSSKSGPTSMDRAASSLGFHSDVKASSMDRAASSTGFHSIRQSMDVHRPSRNLAATPSGPLKTKSSLLGLRAGSSEVDLELSENDSTASSTNLSVPSDREQPKLKSKLSTGSFGFSRPPRDTASEKKHRFTSIKMQKGSSKDSNNFFKVWA